MEEVGRMKNKQTTKTGTYILRNKTSVYEDTHTLISYPNYLVLSWNIVLSTKSVLETILNEEFKDLLVKIVLYCKNDCQNRRTDFVVNKDADAIRLSNLPDGTYYSEMIVTNSQNESITIMCSNKVKCLFVKINANHQNMQWQEVRDRDHSWQSNISGYTIYD